MLNFTVCYFCLSYRCVNLAAEQLDFLNFLLSKDLSLVGRCAKVRRFIDILANIWLKTYDPQ